MASTHIDIGGGGLALVNTVPAGGYIEFVTTAYATFGTSGYISFASNPAQSGKVRLPNAGAVVARNAANSEDLPLMNVTALNEVEFGKYNPTTATSLYFYAHTNGAVNFYAGTLAIFLANATYSRFLTPQIDWRPSGTTAYPSTQYLGYDTSTGTEASDLVTVALDDDSAYAITAEFETYQTGGSSGAAGDYHKQTIVREFTRTAGGAPDDISVDATTYNSARTLAMTYALVVSGNNIIARATNPANTNVRKKVTLSVSKVA